MLYHVLSHSTSRVFNFDLNWATGVTEAGRLFHSLGQATEKARLLNLRFVQTTANSPRVSLKADFIPRSGSYRPTCRKYWSR